MSLQRQDSFEIFPEGLKSNLFSAAGAQWHRVRHLMTPTFSSGKLKLMDAHINKCSVQLINNIEKAIDKGERVDVKKVYGAFTMDVIAQTAFGIEINSQEDLNHPFVKSATLLVSFVSSNAWYRVVLMAMPCLMPVVKFLVTYVFKQQGWTPFSETVQCIMQQRKSEGKSAQKHTDFLQMILDHEENEKPENGRLKSLSEAEVLGQATVILLGGFETTATTLQFLSYNLALHPEIQEKVVQEIKDQLGDGDVTYEDVAKLKYLDKVIHETLRMYPPLNIINRLASETVTIKGVTIPKGAGVLIPIANVLNDPEYFPEPDKFIPERFSEENKGSRNPISLLQFGFGPRICIGMRLALLEMKIAMVYVLRRVKFIKTDDLQGRIRIRPGSLVSGPERPIMIKAVLRE
ncbi:hypothetical protein C0Q70_01002 [Pomacea canaliculata]|uniref:Cytochrome P450 n=1 Tax=Pomacea canaliculata TaxID=400727 RepID=A0A2T7PYA4_POMCA|nr:hypothetical protein C0Q70_01002 [Pomacea canaliculata]